MHFKILRLRNTNNWFADGFVKADCFESMHGHKVSIKMYLTSDLKYLDFGIGDIIRYTVKTLLTLCFWSLGVMGKIHLKIHTNWINCKLSSAVMCFWIW